MLEQAHKTQTREQRTQGEVGDESGDRLGSLQVLEQTHKTHIREQRTQGEV